MLEFFVLDYFKVLPCLGAKGSLGAVGTEDLPTVIASPPSC